MDTWVSVVIPAFNAAGFIGRALASVESQTRRPYDVVVVDDGSTDETASRVEAYSKTSALNIKFESQTNRGSAAARNRGIALASGSLIALMDADDMMYPQFLERTTFALASRASWSACFTDRDVVDTNGTVLSKDLDHPGFVAIAKCSVGTDLVELVDPSLFSKMVAGSVIPMTIVCRRTIVERVRGFDENIRFHEDRLFLLKIIKLGGVLGYVNKPLGIWQRHSTNKTGACNNVAGLESSDRILEELLTHKGELNLTAHEVAAVTAERKHVASQLLYVLSSAGSAATLQTALRLIGERRIGFRLVFRAGLRYGVNNVRRYMRWAKP